MMKIKKERKPFKREYIPIILAVILLFVLIGGLIYIIGHDFKFDEEKVNPNQHEQEEVLIDNSNSKCSKDELNELYKLAEKIKVETEMREIEDKENEVYDFDLEKYVPGTSVIPIIKFSNLNAKVYVQISNDFNDKKQELKSEKANDELEGIASDKIVEYTLEVKANDYSCKGETIRKFTVKTPIYNSFSQMDACADYPEYDYCKEYITENIPTMHDFQVGLQNYKKNIKSTVAPKFTNNSKSTSESKATKATNDTKDKKENKKDNKTIIYIAIGVLILIVGVAIATLILMKKKRSKEV